eukprot:5375800-Pyramimonas_sp.AAC.1
MGGGGECAHTAPGSSCPALQEARKREETDWLPPLLHEAVFENLGGLLCRLGVWRQAVKGGPCRRFWPGSGRPLG